MDGREARSESAGVARRDVLRSLSAAGAAAVLGAGRGRAQQSTEGTWPQFAGGSRNAGSRSGGAAIRTGVETDWTAGLPGAAARQPVVDGARVYAPAEENGIVAIDRDTREQAWSATPGEVRAQPATDGETVVVGVNTGSGISDAAVYALSAADGSVQWSREQAQAATTTPTIRDGSVYYSASTGGNSRALFARSLDDGTEEWIATSVSAPYPPAVTDDAVYVVSSFDDGPAAAYDRETGERRWETPVGQFPSTPVAVGSGYAFVETDGTLSALSTDDGSVEWQREGDYASIPAITGEGVYVATAGGAVEALTFDGDRQWQYERDARAWNPVVGDGVIYARFGSESGLDDTLAALDAADGTELWAADFEDGTHRRPIVLGDRLYAVVEGELRALVEGESTPTPTPTRSGGSSPGERTVTATPTPTRSGGSDPDGRTPTPTASPAPTPATPPDLVGTDTPTPKADPDPDDGFEEVDGVEEIDGAEEVDGDADDGSDPGLLVGGLATVGFLGTLAAWRVYGDDRPADGGGGDEPAGGEGGDGSAGAGESASDSASDGSAGDASDPDPGTAAGGDAGTAAGGDAGTAAGGDAGTAASDGTEHVTAAAAEPVADPVPSWPATRYDAARTAAASGVAAPADPSAAWTIALDDPRTAPVVVDGHAIVPTATELVAVDANYGGEVWSDPLDGGDPTSPVAADGRVYVGTDAGVAARDTFDGGRVWTLDTAGVTAAPVVADGVVYAATQEGVRALDAETGGSAWRADVGRISSLAVADGLVYALGDDVYGFDAATGEEAGTISAPSTLTSIAADGVMVLSGESGLGGRPADGDAWTASVALAADAVALVDGRVYASGTDGVLAFDAGTGERLWTAAVDTTTAPVVAGRTVYVGTAEGVAALASADGGVRFTRAVEGVRDAPAVAGAGLFVPTDGGLTALAGDVGDASPAVVPVQESATGDEDSGTTDGAAEPAGTEGADEATPSAAGRSGPADGDASPAADRFARACDAVSSAATVDAGGPIHAYDAALADGVGPDGVDAARVLALAPDADADDAFERSVRRWNGVSTDPNVAAVYGTGDRPRPWVAFDAGDRRLVDAAAGMDADERFRVLEDAVAGINTAELYNVTHGTVAPETVVITDDERPSGALADWGLTREVGAAVGDPPVTPYAAPEQLDGDTAATTDVYRVGALAYRLLTDRTPFADAADLAAAIREGDHVAPSEAADCSELVDDALDRAMATDPDERYDSVSDFRGAIRGALP